MFLSIQIFVLVYIISLLKQNWLCILRVILSRQLYFFFKPVEMRPPTRSRSVPVDEPSVGFKHRDPKFYSNINVCRLRAESKAGDAEHQVLGSTPRVSLPEENIFHLVTCTFLGHSTMLFLLIVKNCIVANDVQLRIKLIIL